MATVEAAILQIIEADASLADRFAILTSIPGVSNITAFALLIARPELSALEASQAANLRRPRADRPTVRAALGRSLIAIRGGRADVTPGALHARPRRRTLQPRHEGQYAHLIETGKPAKIALDVSVI